MDSISVIRDSNIVIAIKDFIDVKLGTDELTTEFPNALLREDVLDLLDRYCTVIYFPLENESNNGFHTNMLQKNGEECHFVFINTAQSIAKQVFTAAHELGHIWKVDDYVASKCGLSPDDELREKVINRFAAELLIPEQMFRSFFDSVVTDTDVDNGQISLSSMLKLIAKMMNFFFVPMKSIVLRLLEFEIIDEKGAELLLGNGSVSDVVIQEELDKAIKELGCTKLLKSTEKKWIKGLAEMLDAIDNKGVLPAEKIESVRAKFEIERKDDVSELNNTVDLTVQKEDGACDGDK